MDRLQQLFNRLVGVGCPQVVIEDRWNPGRRRGLPQRVEVPACWRRHRTVQFADRRRCS